MVVSVILCISLMRTWIFTQMKSENAQWGKKEENSDGYFLCVPHCLLLLALCLNKWTRGGSISKFPFPWALAGLSSGEAHQEVREEKSQLGYLFLRLPPYRLPQVARVLQARTSAPCKTVIAIEPSPPGFQSPCLHPLHPFKLRRRSSSAMTALSCFTISWISPKPCPCLHK